MNNKFLFNNQYQGALKSILSSSYALNRLREIDAKDGLEAPSTDPLDVPAARTWIARWLAERYGQLGDNMGTTNQSDVRREFVRQMGNMYNTPIYTDLRRMASEYTSQENHSGEHLANTLAAATSPGTKGVFSNAEGGGNRLLYVNPNSRNASSTLLHELSHSLSHDGGRYLSKPQESAIHRIMGAGGMRPGVTRNDSYIDSPTEIYSRLMEFRKQNNLDPTKTYTEEDLDEIRKSAKDVNLLNRYSDEVLLQLINKVASVSPVDGGSNINA